MIINQLPLEREERMKTIDVKRLLKEKGIAYWQMARELNVSENTFYRMMRDREIPQEEEKRIITAMDSIKGDTPND